MEVSPPSTVSTVGLVDRQCVTQVRHVVVISLSTYTSAGAHPVVATTLSWQPSGHTTHVLARPLQRVLAWAVPKGVSKDIGKISSTDDLKVAIREQLNGDTATEDFDVGFVEGSNVVGIRSKPDLHELWSGLTKPTNLYSSSVY